MVGETEAERVWRLRYETLQRECRRLVAVATKDSVAFFRSLAEIRKLVGEGASTEAGDV